METYNYKMFSKKGKKKKKTHFFKKRVERPSIVVHVHNSSSQEAEAKGKVGSAKMLTVFVTGSLWFSIPCESFEMSMDYSVSLRESTLLDSRFQIQFESVIPLKRILFESQGSRIRYWRVHQKPCCPLWACWFQAKLWLSFPSWPHSPGELDGCARNLHQMCG